MEVCGLLGVSEWEVESSVEPGLLMEVLRYFLSEVLLWLLGMMEVLESGEAGDDDSDDIVVASVVFLLILLFVVVGSIGSHLTRAAFVERLVIVVVFRLLEKKIISVNLFCGLSAKMRY